MITCWLSISFSVSSLLVLFLPLKAGSTARSAANPSITTSVFCPPVTAQSHGLVKLTLKLRCTPAVNVAAETQLSFWKRKRKKERSISCGVITRDALGVQVWTTRLGSCSLCTQVALLNLDGVVGAEQQPLG